MDEIFSTRLSTAKETARVLAISERKLWSLTKNGEIDCIRIGASVRYSPEAIARFIEANTTSHTK